MPAKPIDAVLLADVVDRGDVGVLERRRQPCRIQRVDDPAMPQQRLDLVPLHVPDHVPVHGGIRQRLRLAPQFLGPALT